MLCCYCYSGVASALETIRTVRDHHPAPSPPYHHTVCILLGTGESSTLDLTQQSTTAELCSLFSLLLANGFRFGAISKSYLPRIAMHEYVPNITQRNNVWPGLTMILCVILTDERGYRWVAHRAWKVSSDQMDLTALYYNSTSRNWIFEWNLTELNATKFSIRVSIIISDSIRRDSITEGTKTRTGNLRNQFVLLLAKGVLNIFSYIHLFSSIKAHQLT